MKEDFRKQIKSLGRLLMVFGLLFMILIGSFFYLKYNPKVLNIEEVYEDIPMAETPTIELNMETIQKSGFINDSGVSQVIQNCTQCHSAKLVTQNRMNKEGWEATIVWMQETQNLWDLGYQSGKNSGLLSQKLWPKK